MTKLAIAALTGLALLMPQTVSSSYAAGVSSAKIDISASRKKKPKYSRAHCMKLNPEKARMYGICREYLR